MKRARRGRVRAVSCDDVRQAVSACYDGEASKRTGAVVHAHLQECHDCRQLTSRMEDVARLRILCPSRPVPEALMPQLAETLSSNAIPKLRVRPAPRRSRLESLGGLRWVAAAPALVASIALPLGVGERPLLAPSHIPTPCTADIRVPNPSFGRSTQGARHPSEHRGTNRLTSMGALQIDPG
jgi:hypothetical protein